MYVSYAKQVHVAPAWRQHVLRNSLLSQVCCCLQGAAMIAQYAVKHLQVDLQSMSLRKSFYLAFGAAGALLRYQYLRILTLLISLKLAYTWCEIIEAL